MPNITQPPWKFLHEIWERGCAPHAVTVGKLGNIGGAAKVLLLFVAAHDRICHIPIKLEMWKGSLSTNAFSVESVASTSSSCSIQVLRAKPHWSLSKRKEPDQGLSQDRCESWQPDHVWTPMQNLGCHPSFWERSLDLQTWITEVVLLKDLQIQVPL